MSEVLPSYEKANTVKTFENFAQARKALIPRVSGTTITVTQLELDAFDSLLFKANGNKPSFKPLDYYFDGYKLILEK